jgi:hypothetical protein
MKNIHSFIYSFIHSFVLSFFRSFVRSFVLSFVHSFVCSLVRLFVHSFVCSFIHLFIHSFIRLSWIQRQEHKFYYMFFFIFKLRLCRVFGANNIYFYNDDKHCSAKCCQVDWSKKYTVRSFCSFFFSYSSYTESEFRTTIITVPRRLFIPALQ